ncbi:myelin basic protein b isoform X2 [Scomber japonicus]|uniref:myelin basic protein b isoform X2 n=1 Tax=Scomber japonicus TaxID=13676 RepID=UPI0023056CB9|nr:myelin basic protein b isoform X2 [Scomber japonicus]
MLDKMNWSLYPFGGKQTQLKVEVQLWRSTECLGEADANQNNGCVSEKPVVTDSTGAEGPHQPWDPASTADPDAATPRPHLVRLFSRDAPGREDNTFKDRPSESDELQTIHEHSGAASECGSDIPEQDLE